MAKSKNVIKPKQKVALLYLEGYTESIFYSRVFEKYLSSIKKHSKNLKSGSGINKEIASLLFHFLSDGKNSSKEVYVYVFIDREGPASKIPEFNSQAILSELSKHIEISQIQVLEKIEAIKMIESWFFYDLEGICNFIGLSCSDSLKKTYGNCEQQDHKSLANLFRKGSKHKYYKKGDPSFLSSLDIDKIFNNCTALKEGIGKIIKDLL